MTFNSSDTESEALVTPCDVFIGEQLTIRMSCTSLKRCLARLVECFESLQLLVWTVDNSVIKAAVHFMRH